MSNRSGRPFDAGTKLFKADMASNAVPVPFPGPETTHTRHQNWPSRLPNATAWIRGARARLRGCESGDGDVLGHLHLKLLSAS